MTSITAPPIGAPAIAGEPGAKGLNCGALGIVSSVVIGVASTAPAYCLASSLGLVVIAPRPPTASPSARHAPE